MAEGGSSGDCELQKTEIQEAVKAALKKGETWFLIDTKWFKQWKKYVGYDSWDTGHVGDETAYPGPIDNNPLYKEGSTDLIKEHLIDELDYVLLPKKAWAKFEGWYGMVEGQVAIERKVIEHGMFVKHCKVEVYLMDLKLCPNTDLENVITKHFSRADTIDEIEQQMRLMFHIDTDKGVRLWNKYMTNTYEHLNKPENTVQDVGLYSGQIIVIEEQNDDGTWPRQTKSTGSKSHAASSTKSSTTDNSQESISSYGSTSRSTSYSGGDYYGSSGSSYYNSYTDSKSCQPGLCGLNNLGNTCFMNSAIQCMSNVGLLTEHMLSDMWKEDLNYDNPLGMKGEIATSYAEMVKNMWSGQFHSIMPRTFKMAVGRFAPQFSGYQQQDAQELMAFLLDGLHEDLNRIKNKPYVELKDADGRPDNVVASESWENYRKRNDSVIVDTFHGQLKSTLVCPECKKISVTFDPFCYLSLPLPYKKERSVKVILVPQDPSKTRRQYKLLVPTHGIVSDLCQALSKLSGVSAAKMVVTDVYNHRLHKVFTMEEALNHILDRDDIYVYEVPVTSDDPDTHIIHVYLREQKEKQSYYSHNSAQLFGYPILVPVPRENCTYEVLYNCVINRLQRYIKAPDIKDEWWKTETEPVTNGEVEMDEESGEVNGTSKKDDITDDDDDDDNGWTKDKQGRPRMFKISVINSYGSAEMDKIKGNDEPIKLTSRMYLAADWHPKAKEKFYLETEAEELEVDESMSMRPKKHTIQLTECLDLFTTREQLGKQDPWFCPQCKEFRQATKKFDLWKLPNVLVIHLKRFHYNRLWRDKLDAVVEYPTRGLDMKRWIIDSEHGAAQYDLKGVVNHYGGMGGGHYTAYCQNKDDRQWYNFDDSSVSQTTEDSVVTKAGYVLVYQQHDLTSRGSETITNGNGVIDDDMDTN